MWKSTEKYSQLLSKKCHLFYIWRVFVLNVLSHIFPLVTLKATISLNCFIFILHEKSAVIIIIVILHVLCLLFPLVVLKIHLLVFSNLITMYHTVVFCVFCLIFIELFRLMTMFFTKLGSFSITSLQIYVLSHFFLFSLRL